MRSSYSYNKENNNYIMIRLEEDLKELLQSGEINNTDKIFLLYHYNVISEKSHINDDFKEPIAIPINSELGTFITSRKDLFYCSDEEELTYKKIAISYLVATLEENHKIANKIRGFLKDHITGVCSELINEKNKDVIDYMMIKGTCDIFEEEQNKDIKPNIYGVYENGEYKKKYLVEKPAVKQKK